MAMTTYNYTKTPVNSDRLSLEIRESAIVTALDHITTSGEDLNITFKAELSLDDKSVLDTIVTNHSGAPLPDYGLPVNITLPAEVIPTTIKNEHCMQPWGCVKGYFETRGASDGDLICAITLSDRSEDGKTFTYNSDIPVSLAIGNYVFQKHNTLRSWVTAFDEVNHKVTFEMPFLENGVGIYTKGYYVDCLVRDWKSIMYLWGLTVTSSKYDSNDNLITTPNEDFVELSIVDIYDLFKTDEVCQALFGVNAADATPYITAMGFEDVGEYGHWVKYYDESWLRNCVDKYVSSPDGSPGAILANLWLRLSVFTTENIQQKCHVYIDYYPTSKE